MNYQDIRPTVSRVLLAGLLSFLLLTPSASAQTPAPRAAEQDSKEITQTYNDAKIRTLPDKSKRYAVIIGVDKYTADKNITQLNGASNDAQAIADALIKYAGFLPENVMLITSKQDDTSKQPGRTVILNALKSLKYRVGMEKDALLFVAFSGHGLEREQDHQAFLMPADASANPDDWDDSAISVSRMKDLIKQSGANQIILVLDACRNDPTAGRGDKDNLLTESYTKGFDFDRRNSGIKAFITLYAAEVGQRAYEYEVSKDKKQGYFSLAFVEALRGAGGATANDRGEVTLGSVVKYLQTEVPRRVQANLRGKQQRPYPVQEGFADDLVLSVSPEAAKLRQPEVAPAPVVIKPTTGSLTVVSTPGARVLVEAVAGGFKTELKGAKDGVPLKDLKPGDYRVKSELDGFAPRETTVKVGTDAAAVATLMLEAVTHSVTVKTNVTTGKVLFGLKGEPQTLADIRNGQATMTGLRHGAEYVFNVSTDEVGYLAKTESRVLSTDATLEVKLERALAAQPVEAEFSAANWDVPAAWRLAPGLTVSGAGVGLLRDEIAGGHFANLQLITNIELTSGQGVSLVFRARDRQNYYLVRLSGPKAGDSPDTLRFYVVKDGRQQQLGSASVKGFHLNEQFDFTVTAKENEFLFVITDDTGKPMPAARFFDPKNTFTAGSVGVAANAGEQAKIGRFYICPNVCQ